VFEVQRMTLPLLGSLTGNTRALRSRFGLGGFSSARRNEFKVFKSSLTSDTGRFKDLASSS
jgi:hypothetical protein